MLIGRVTPVVRSFISIPAGVFRAPLPRYTGLTAVGSAVWCFAIAGAGWALGSSWERFHKGFRFADYIVILIVVLGTAWLGRRLVSAQKRRRDT